VTELVANNGVPPSREAGLQQQVPFLRRRGISVGAKLVFLSLFLLPISLVGSIVFDSPGPFALPFIIFMVGLAQVLYTLLFKEQDRLGISGARPTNLNTLEHRFSFPVSQGTPVTLNDSQRVHTAEMVRPPSVTEHTTRLLDDNS
jgi:hypothetical protein